MNGRFFHQGLKPYVMQGRRIFYPVCKKAGVENYARRGGENLLRALKYIGVEYADLKEVQNSEGEFEVTLIADPTILP